MLLKALALYLGYCLVQPNFWRMRMKVKQIIIFWSRIALVIPCALANANLLVNGSFEMPAVPNNSADFYNSIPGWTVTGPAESQIEIQNNIAGSPFDGVQQVELDSHWNSGIRQIVATVPGTPYLLSFAYSPRPGQSSETNGIEVYFNGVLEKTITADGTKLSDTQYTRYMIDLIPTTDNSVVEFRAIGTNDSYGGYLDDVILVPRTTASSNSEQSK